MYATVTVVAGTLESITKNTSESPSGTLVSFTLILGILSSSRIVATHVPSLIVAFVGLVRRTLNVSLDSAPVSCKVTTCIAHVVEPLVMVSVFWTCV